MLGRLLAGAAIVWPLVAGAAVWQRTSLPGGTAEAGRPAVSAPAWTTAVYAIGSRICHQKPERSFHTHDVAWPVCARCAGLYLAAPFAAVLAFRRRPLNRSRLYPLRLVALAAIPTALTLFWEWGGLGTPSNLVRFATALPLGAAVAYILIATVRDQQPSNSIG